jgi:hypothetical protein
MIIMKMLNSRKPRQTILFSALFGVLSILWWSGVGCRKVKAPYEAIDTSLGSPWGSARPGDEPHHTDSSTDSDIDSNRTDR